LVKPRSLNRPPVGRLPPAAIGPPKALAMSVARHSRWFAVCLLALLYCRVADAGPIRPGFDAAALPAGDDASSGPVKMGFAVNFFGQSFNSIYVNTNGNLTFGAPLSDFTPVPLGRLREAVIAPFFADVDTSAAGRIAYGNGTVDGHAAFAATWSGVGYYNAKADRVNDFQAVIVNRSDTGAGNFDAEFNYGRVQWEAGDFNGGIEGRGGSTARVGFAGGSGQPGTYYELPGSGTPGAFLDGAAQTALASAMLNSDTPGRIILQGRDGVVTGWTVESPTPTESGSSGPPIGGSGGGIVGTPEPGTLALACLGMLGLAVRFRQRATSRRRG
jgi:hypothetical protein